MTPQEHKEVGDLRNSCNKYGFESVAIIPLEIHGENFGLLQINDPRENMFTRKKIEKLEEIASQVAKIIEHALDLTEKLVSR